MSGFRSLSLNQLRTELRKRGAKLSGRKKELVERLEAYERNNNFDRHEDLLPEYRMMLPNGEKYKDVNSDTKIAPLDSEKAAEYMDRYNVSFDDKVCDLYSESFLLYLRVAYCDGIDFLRSACRAEMKKQITYTVDISVKKNGFVLEAQCECAAGEGPYGHCKHIRTVLLACCKFVQNSEVNVETSSTEKLQSFHKAKKHTGSPMKARDLPLDGADSVCDVRDFETREPLYISLPGYSNYFYNRCMNEKGISSKSIFQLFEPANVRAFCCDHDYLTETHEDMFLRGSKLLAVTDEDCTNIEECTRGQASNQRWMDERGKRLQSSNFYRVCVANEKKDMDKLAKSLINPKIVDNEAMRHGRKYEKEAIHAYETRTGKKVLNCGIFVSKSRPFLGASPDGVVNSELLCEVKCPFQAKNQQISANTVPYLKENGGSMELKKAHPYYYQIQGQLFCAERSACDLIVYTITDMMVFHIERDNQFISSMVEKLECFFHGHFRSALLDHFFYKDF